jgi:hypothetical protein
MAVDKYELGKKMIALASQYREMGDGLSTNAYTRFAAHAISRQDYDNILENVKKLFEQAAKINRAVADIPDGIDADLMGIENATQKLKQATDRINKIEKIVKISIDALTAIGAVVIAATAPSPGTIATAAKSAVDLAKEIIEMTSQKKDKKGNALASRGR